MRQAERREATRGAIVAAAVELFAGRGFAGATMDEIAQRAGVAKGAVYHHFPTKEAVFEAVFEITSARLAEQISVVAASAVDALEALAAGAGAYFEACSHGATGRILLQDGPAVLGWEKWRRLDEKYFGGTIPAALKAAARAGVIEDQPITPLAQLLLGALTEAAVACATSDDPASTAADLAQGFRALLQGLRK